MTIPEAGTKPWKARSKIDSVVIYDSEGHVLGDFGDEKEAEITIRSVNMHDKLVAALKEIEDIGNWASDGRAQQLADRLLTVTGIAQSALKELHNAK